MADKVPKMKKHNENLQHFQLEVTKEISNFEVETVADTKQLEAQPKNGVAYIKGNTCKFSKLLLLFYESLKVQFQL